MEDICPPTAAAMTTMSWTLGASKRWAIGAVPIKPSGVTAVALRSLSAMEHGDGVLLHWQTGYEVDNLGFHLYREVAGERKRLTPGLLGGSALLAGAGTALTAGWSYQWWH